MKHKLIYWTKIAILGTILGSLGVFSYLYMSVKNSCAGAVSKYQGNCVNAATALLLSESESIKAKNQAVWTLGQLADKHALPVLKSPASNSQLDQYELSKAIRWCEQGNITSWMYQGL